ncbi:hypothetical protein CN481_00255 [Bacillus sp. AFS006103]|nr:hypothetical protein CN481_00255 [Bacillus sp. AFS006103]
MMKFTRVFNNYEKDTVYQPRSSLQAHRGKVRKYHKKLGDVEMEEVFKEENLREFIYNNNTTDKNIYSALVNFHQYYYQSILKQEIIPPFPVQDKNLKTIKSKDNINRPVLLEKDEINRLFDDDFYKHLDEEKAILTVKASIALCLSAGYDTGDFSPSNLDKAMTLDDIEISDNFVIVKNFASQSTVPNITIRGECGDHIRNYYNVRIHSNVDSENFITKIWNARNLKYTKELQKEKPYEPHQLINYFLKYVSMKLGLENTLHATHLRTNMVYHSLLNSSGTSLHQIIEVFGFPPYVQYAFERYCEDTNNTKYFGFNDFFVQTSSEQNDSDPSSSGEENDRGIENHFQSYLLQKRPRDSKKVKEIKKLYDNTCQICGTSLTFLPNINYSEVHHIQPHGKEHNGMDDFPNMLVLCPNHHTLFDLGIIGLNPKNPDIIVHIDPNNPMDKTKLKVLKHDLSGVCVRYHYEKIFIPLVEDCIYNQVDGRKG